MDVIASHFNARVVLSAVNQFASSRITSTSWIDRYSAVVALFVIVEHCHDEITEMLGEIARQLRPLLMDETPAVCKKTAFWFSEISEYESDALFTEAPWILQDIISVFSSSFLSQDDLLQSSVAYRKWTHDFGMRSDALRGDLPSGSSASTGRRKLRCRV